MMLGIKAYEFSDSLQGPKGFKTQFQQEDDMFGGMPEEGDSKPNPHLGKAVELDGKTIQSMPMSGNPTLMRTNDACMGCHDKRSNALELAKRAAAIETSPHILDTLAESYFVNGRYEEAIETEKQALSIAKKDRSLYKKQLEKYKSAAGY